MSDHNWCHGPECHTYTTQSRIRGSGRDKVLRTIKIKQGRYNGYQNSVWDYFCNQRCLMDFIKAHKDRIVALAPRREALELPVNITKTTETNWSGNNYTRTNIERVDNS